MKIQAVEPNPDGLDEVFEAHRILGLVLQHARLCPNSEDPEDEAAAESQVEDALDALSSFIEREYAKTLEAADE